MTKLTLSLDEDMIRAVKAIAAHNGTSIHAIVRDYFNHLIDNGLAKPDTLSGNQELLFKYSMGRIPKNVVMKELGLGDYGDLQRLMYASGYPLPRLSEAQTKEMAEKADPVFKTIKNG